MNYGIGNVKGKSSGGSGTITGGNVWHTYTQANFIDDEATFSIGNIAKPNDATLSVADKILYVDNNDKIVECYVILAIGDISVTLGKVGDFGGGGGSQKYQHNIHIIVGANGNIGITIINDNNTPINSHTALLNSIDNTLFNSINNLYTDVSGLVDAVVSGSSGHYIPVGLYVDTVSGIVYMYTNKTNGANNRYSYALSNANNEWYDTIKPL